MLTARSGDAATGDDPMGSISPEAAVAGLDAFSEQPYPLWAALRDRCPVARAGTDEHVNRPVFYVTSWADVDAVLHDSETFSSSINAEHVGQFMGPMMLALDGKEHRSYRALVSGAFRASNLQEWETSLVLPTINEILDEVSPNGRADLVAEVTSRFPVRVICGMFGVPRDDSEKFLRWATEIHRGMLNVEVGMAASNAMRDYLEPIVDDRRANPQNDLISDVVNAEIDGRQLTEEEIYGFLRLLLPAGSESTYRAMGMVLVALLTNPALLDRVSDDRSLLLDVIEETLRWESPVPIVSRVATRDTFLNGCPIPKGAALTLYTGSGNHDKARFENADAFNTSRPTQRTLTFGTGTHQCLGMHLARMELRVGVNAVLDRLPGLRLDPTHPTPLIEGYSFRGPAELWALFDSA
jgi:cytochrome P450